MPFSSKDPGEQELFTFDFINRLNPGETISSSLVTVILLSGVDPSPSSMLVGSSVYSLSRVQQMIRGGLAGNVYILKCTITTSLSQTLVITNDLPIIVST